jgi:outer membrane receptor protein involved in Fe transport
MRHRWRSTCIGFGLVLTNLVTTSEAQELEVVTVTARKTEETLQDAPVAVSAFTAKTIESQGLRSIDDLAKFSPGLSFSQAFGRTTDRPVIRGQSNVLAGFQFGVESGTAYFIDGVYYPGDIQGIDFDSLERVEVVKGPQSALYGRNTYAGAINFITRQPGETPEAHVKASIAEFGEQDYSGSVGSSFFDGRLGARLSVRSYEYGGEYINELTGKKVGQESTKSAALTINYKPTSDLTFTATGLYREDDDGVFAQFQQTAAENNCKPGYRSTLYRDPPGAAATGGNQNQYFCGVIRPGVIRINSEPMPVNVGGVTQTRDATSFDGAETNEFFGALRMDWNIGGSGWVATALGGYRNSTDLLGAEDYSDAFLLFPQFNPSTFSFMYSDRAEPLFTNTYRNDYTDYSTELRIASPKDRRLRGLLGVYRFEMDNDASDLTFDAPRKGLPSYKETVEDNAVFGLLAFDITDRLTISGEVRYTEESKKREDYCAPNAGSNDYNWFTDTCTNVGFAMQPGNPAYYTRALGTTLYQGETKFTSTTPRVTLDWKLPDGTLLYGVYAQGAKPGGLNGILGRNLGVPSYDQEESDNFELGAKWAGLDDRLRINASVYFTKATDVQFTQALTAPGSGAVVNTVATNQGEGEIRGAELELQAAITAAVTVSATYAYTHSEVTKGCDDMEYVLNSGGFIYNPALGTVPECDVSGNRYPLGSEHTASASLNYDAPLPWGTDLSLIGNLGLTYEGSKFVQIHNLAETGDATIVNFRLGVRSDRGWSLVAFGRNLTDEDTIPLGQRWFDLNAGSARLCSQVAEPCLPTAVPPGTVGGADIGFPRALTGALRKSRTFGLEFRYDFGR